MVPKEHMLRILKLKLLHTNFLVKTPNHFGRSRKELLRDNLRRDASCGDFLRTGFRGELPRASPVTKN